MHLRIKKVSDIVQKEKEPCLLINWIIGIERVRCDNNILVRGKRKDLQRMMWDKKGKYNSFNQCKWIKKLLMSLTNHVFILLSFYHTYFILIKKSSKYREGREKKKEIACLAFVCLRIKFNFKISRE